MKKVAALFFLLLLVELVSFRQTSDITVFNEEENEYELYELTVTNNGINTKNMNDIFKNVDVIGIIPNDKTKKYYKFKNYILEKNIQEFEEYYKKNIENLDSINSLSIIERDGVKLFKIIIYTNKNDLNDLLISNDNLIVE